jgi:hypothetical protein
MADNRRVMPGSESGHLKSVIERYNDQPDHCTIFDPDRERCSTWITAKEGSYVDLCICR